jgi:hypothetical protein
MGRPSMDRTIRHGCQVRHHPFRKPIPSPMNLLVPLLYCSTVILFICANHDERYGADPELESETLARGGLEKEKDVGDVVV